MSLWRIDFYYTTTGSFPQRGQGRGVGETVRGANYPHSLVTPVIMWKNKGEMWIIRITRQLLQPRFKDQPC